MGFADAFVADLIRAGAQEDPDPEVLKDLLEQYKTSPGTGPGRPPDPVRDQIILQLAIPVYNLTRRYRTRNNADDILGEAMLALVDCVDRWWEVAEDDNIRTYVEFCVKKRIKDWIDNDRVLGMPSRTLRDKLSKGESVQIPKVLTLYTYDSYEPEEGDIPPHTPPDTSFDIQEFFAAREDPRDRAVVEMRVEGCSADEIAKKLNMSRRWVFKKLRDLEKAFSEMNMAG